MGAPEKSLIPKGKKLPIGKDYENLARKDKLAIQKIIKDDNTQREVNAIKNKYIADNALQVEAEAMQKHINDQAKKRDDAAGMNKGGMPKKNFAKPGSYSSAYNKGGSAAKPRTGSMDYRKGGMISSTKSKK